MIKEKDIVPQRTTPPIKDDGSNGGKNKEDSGGNKEPAKGE